MKLFASQTAWYLWQNIPHPGEPLQMGLAKDAVSLSVDVNNHLPNVGNGSQDGIIAVCGLL